MDEAESRAEAGPSRSRPRLFVAVPLVEEARAAVEGLVEEVRADLRSRQEPGTADARQRDIRWVRMNGLHLTLRFLGPTPAAEVDAVRTVVAEAARAATPFEVVITGSGAFPSGMKPRTLWLGITDGRAQLEAVAADVSSKLELLGWPPEERPFRGHLTLGRSDGRVDGRAVAQLLDEHAAAFRTSFRADRLVLFESVTGRGPAVYEPLYEASFSA